MTEQLFASVDVQAELEARLPRSSRRWPARSREGSAPSRSALPYGSSSGLVSRSSGCRPSGAQAQIVRVLDDDARFLETDEGVVVLDLRPLLVELTDQAADRPEPRGPAARGRGARDAL